MKNIIKIALLLCITNTIFTVYGQDSRTTDEGVVINGVRWATRNVDKPGTFTEKPEDAGMFYQWNRKVGWSSSDPLVNSDGETEWNANEAAGESWSKENDPCPCGWRVPTYEELQSLGNVSSEWSELNGKTGRFFDSGRQFLFLPAAGHRDGSSSTLSEVDTNGYYSINDTSVHHVEYLYFYSRLVTVGGSHTRAHGMSLRCVAENK